MGEHHALTGADVLHFARRRVGEAVALADLHALHASVAVANDPLEIRAKTGLHAETLELFEFLVDDFGARTGLENRAARHRMTAFLRNAFLHPLDAEFLDGPLPGGERLAAHVEDLVGMVHPGPFADHVLGHEFGGVLVPLFLLHRRSGNAHDAAVDGRIAARDAHLLEHAHARARQARLDRRGKSGKARTDHDDVEGFVPFRGHRVRALRAGGGSSGKKRGARGCGLEPVAAGKSGHSFLLGVCFPISAAGRAVRPGAVGAIFRQRLRDGQSGRIRASGRLTPRADSPRKDRPASERPPENPMVFSLLPERLRYNAVFIPTTR